MDAAAIEGIVFDLYGTLLEVRSVERRCAGIASDPAAFVGLWRTKQLEYAFLRGLMGRYADFWSVTGDALDYTAARLGVALDDGRRATLMSAWLDMRPYPEALGALARLHHHTLAVLSNGSPAMLEQGLAAAGLQDRFQHILSVDAVGAYKPSPAVYALAPAALNLPTERLLFVSSNAWDAAGAAAFGLRVCWVNRAGVPMERLGVTPDLGVRDLDGLIRGLRTAE